MNSDSLNIVYHILLVFVCRESFCKTKDLRENQDEELDDDIKLFDNDDEGNNNNCLTLCIQCDLETERVCIYFI